MGDLYCMRRSYDEDVYTLNKASSLSPLSGTLSAMRLRRSSSASKPAAFIHSAMILNAFNDQVWPAIKEGLDALQALIPDELASMGLQLVPLVKSVINFIINKAVTWAMKKVFLKMEELLFTQAYE